MKISICIPMYNEIETVSDCADALFTEMNGWCIKTGDTAEIIFSCDGSTDGSFDAVPTSLSNERVEIKRVRSEINRGKGAAVRRAVLSSGGDIVIYTDCDLAYGTAVITEIIKKRMESGADLIVGSRAIHPDGYGEYSLSRKLASKVYMKILSVYTGFSLSDSQCGLKLIRGDLARSVFSLSLCDGWAFDYEIIMLSEKKGAILGELPVKIINHRDSRIHVFGDSIKMLSELKQIKTRIKNI